MRQIRFRNICGNLEDRLHKSLGPHMDMSDLLEQQTDGSTNNDMPEEDDTALDTPTLEEPQTHILTTGKHAELAADLQAETELMQ